MPLQLAAHKVGLRRTACSLRNRGPRDAPQGTPGKRHRADCVATIDCQRPIPGRQPRRAAGSRGFPQGNQCPSGPCATPETPKAGTPSRGPASGSPRGVQQRAGPYVSYPARGFKATGRHQPGIRLLASRPSSLPSPWPPRFIPSHGSTPRPPCQGFLPNGHLTDSPKNESPTPPTRSKVSRRGHQQRGDLRPHPRRCQDVASAVVGQLGSPR